MSLIFEDLQHRRQEEWWLTPPPPPLPSSKKTIRIFLGDRLLCLSVRSVNSMKAIYHFAHIMQVVVVLIRWESITFWRGVWATHGIYTPWSPLWQQIMDHDMSSTNSLPQCWKDLCHRTATYYEKDQLWWACLRHLCQQDQQSWPVKKGFTVL